MKDLLLKKIEILKKIATELEMHDLDFCALVLKQPRNLLSGTESYICNIEVEICKRVPKESHQSFHDELGKVNKEIENYKICHTMNF